MEDCIFCDIVDGKAPSHIIFEDENVIAFLDSKPVSKGHTLVIPKVHVDDIHEASDMEYMWDVLVKVSNALEDAFDPEGINIAQNNGEAAGQEIFHLHFHVTPIYNGDELEIDYDRSDLDNGEVLEDEIKSYID